MKRKPRNALVNNEEKPNIDLGVLDMTAVTPLEPVKPQLSDDCFILDPENWTARNRIILRRT